MSDTYRVPAQRIQTELEIKKSRFICTLDFIETEQQGKALRQQLQADFATANHHCWAHQLGTPQAIRQACSDDGEPHGTAGKPILNQLHHARLVQIQAVVTRIFGGVKLVTGGLVRAYSDATAQALEQLKTEPLISRRKIQMTFGYDLETAVRQLLSSYSFRDDQWHYTDQVMVNCAVPCADCADCAEIKQTLQNLSGGSLVFKVFE
jgi:uncharacterized YigZ family protein